MPRQRKAQNGASRLGSGRVANTTTAPKLQTVYRIPAWRDYGSCEKLAYEVLWTSPIQVRIEWENIYRVSLDETALKNVIESYDSLDLNNVTLQTVNGDVEFTGNITADWTFTWTTVAATTVDATTGNIETVNATDVNATNVSASDVSTATLEASWNATVGWDLEVTWTSTLTWDVTAWANLTVTWDTTTDWLTATTWTITTLTATDTTTDTLTVNNGATVWDGLSVTNWITTDTLAASWNATIGWNLTVTWTSDFTGDVTTQNITSTWVAALENATVSGNLWVTWNTTLNTVTVSWASTLSGNTSVGWNLSVSGNETVTGNSTVTGDAIFSSDVSIAEDLTVSWDATVTDDLTVNGSTHLKTLETTGSVSLGGNLSVDWSIAGWSNLVVENQIESGSLVTTNITTDNITINGNIALWNDATAPDFILQDEKGAANGVAPLDANGKVDPQYLPPVYTTAIVKMGTGVFSNSDTSVVVDADITADSFVIISNYSDIVWDLNETINVWQLTVVSNQTETGSYKYIIVNALN